jgi:hypothetical protein
MFISPTAAPKRVISPIIVAACGHILDILHKDLDDGVTFLNIEIGLIPLGSGYGLS